LALLPPFFYGPGLFLLKREWFALIPFGIGAGILFLSVRAWKPPLPSPAPQSTEELIRVELAAQRREEFVKMFFAAAVLIPGFIWLLWWSYPSELLQKPLATLTLNDLLKVIGWFVMAFCGTPFVIRLIFRVGGD
jgi:hypothetical protein